MLESIIIWAILTLVPLIPTVLLFKLFQSSASFENMKKGIKLGGAAAAYFILVGFAFTSWAMLQPDYTDKSAVVKDNLVGIWDCKYTIKDIQEEGTMYIAQDDANNLVLHGQDSLGNSWEAGNILLNKNKMIFMFNNALSAQLGFTWVNFVYNNDTITSMFGNWVIIQDEKNIQGNITCSSNEI